jgi:hypothetical protein
MIFDFRPVVTFLTSAQMVLSSSIFVLTSFFKLSQLEQLNIPHSVSRLPAHKYTWHILQSRATAIFMLPNPNFLKTCCAMVIHAIMVCTNDYSGIPQIHYYLILKSVLQFSAILRRMHPLKV